VTAGQEKQLRVWNVEQGTQEGTLPGHNGTVRTVSWIGEHTVVSAGQDEVVRVWDLRSMSQSTSCVAKAPVMSLEVSWDGKYITTAAGKEVTFWDAASFAPLKVYTLNIDLNSASLHPSATRFVAGGSDFYVHVYSFETGEEQEVHKGHHGPVHSVSFAPDGETYSSGSEDGTIRIWQNSIKPYGLWSSNHSQSPSHSSHSSHSSHTHNHVYSHSPSHTVHSHSPSHTPPKR
jgi:serine-threonine kinase receptor-associated protein